MSEEVPEVTLTTISMGARTLTVTVEEWSDEFVATYKVEGQVVAWGAHLTEREALDDLRTNIRELHDELSRTADSGLSARLRKLKVHLQGIFDAR